MQNGGTNLFVSHPSLPNAAAPSLQRLDSGGRGTNLFVSQPNAPQQLQNAAPSLERLDSGDVRINYASGVSPHVVAPQKQRQKYSAGGGGWLGAAAADEARVDRRRGVSPLSAGDRVGLRQ